MAIRMTPSEISMRSHILIQRLQALKPLTVASKIWIFSWDFLVFLSDQTVRVRACVRTCVRACVRACIVAVQHLLLFDSHGFVQGRKLRKYHIFLSLSSGSIVLQQFIFCPPPSLWRERTEVFLFSSNMADYRHPHLLWSHLVQSKKRTRLWLSGTLYMLPAVHESFEIHETPSEYFWLVSSNQV